MAPLWRLAPALVCAGCLVDIPDPPGTPPGSGGGAGAVSSNASTSTSTSTAGGSAGTGYSAEVLADMPRGYWRLDETEPLDAIDASGNGLNGFYTGAGTPQLEVAGALANDPNTAVHFDGGSWIDLGDVLDFIGDQPFTIEAWIHPEGDGGLVGKAVYDAAMGGYAGYIWVIQDGKLKLHRSNWGMGDDGAFTDAVLSTTGYTHLVTVWDGVSTIRHYLNGVPENVEIGDATVPDIPDPLRIGSVQDWGNYTGAIDEVALYDYPLSPGRIQAHYEAAQ